jgi:murein endopeptidase
MPPAALPPLPSDADLRRLLHFSPVDGRIWLSDQRMLLVHAASFQALRREFVNSLGAAHTRRLLMRAGYASGQRDALLARQVRPNATLFETFAGGAGQTSGV